jgi:hypothetical protein
MNEKSPAPRPEFSITVDGGEFYSFGRAPAELAKQFKRAKPAGVAEILETLVTMGRARQQAGKFSR